MIKSIKETIIETYAELGYEMSRILSLETGIGIWMGGEVCWNFDSRETMMYGDEVSVKVTVEHPHSKITMLTYHVTNHGKEEKTLKLLSINYLKSICNDHFAFISPADGTCFHLVGEKMFMVDGQTAAGGKWESTVVPSWVSNSEQMFISKETGKLKYQPTAKGNPASILSAEVDIPARMTTKTSVWIISGTNKSELERLNKVLLKNRLAFQKKK